MNSIKDIINNIPDNSGKSNPDEDLMSNGEYLRESSKIISDALHKGYDVLQLENGDIVTTGTKVIVTQYRWDNKKGKMGRLSAKELKELEKEKNSASKAKNKKK